MKKCFAFTLAEVLITLTIIGVIAALTIPNLMRKYQDHTQITALKTAYSILDNALKMSIAENGPVNEWDWPNPNTAYDGENADFFANTLAKHLKVQKYCGRNRGCFQYGKGYIETVKGTYHSSGNIDFAQPSSNAKMILDNGMRLVITLSNPTSGNGLKWDSCIGVDTNGTKGPNKYGYDYFQLGIEENGLTHKGCYDGTNVRNCNPTVVSPSYLGSCQYWVLRKGNMDYKYRDVSAEW